MKFLRSLLFSPSPPMYLLFFCEGGVFFCFVFVQKLKPLSGAGFMRGHGVAGGGAGRGGVKGGKGGGIFFLWV